MTTQGSALRLLIRFKQMMAGQKQAAQERETDERFIRVTTALLEFKSEDETLAWLMKPCRCLDCQNVAKSPPRIEMINAEVSFRHLMEWVAIEGRDYPSQRS